jgi:hypothetical protein
MRLPSAAKGFAFIEADASGRTPADRRQLIRSRVMRGKNTAKRVPRLRGTAAEALPTSSNESSDDGHTRRRFTFWPSPLPAPLKPLPDLALCIVAEEVDETSRGFIRQCEHPSKCPPRAIEITEFHWF